MTVTREMILKALDGVHDPELHQSIVALGMVKDIGEVQGASVPITVELTTPACPLKAVIETDIRRALVPLGITSADIQWTARVRSRDLAAEDPIPEVANVVVVMSGKGGVGKSTIAVNLALALKAAGARVGLLDADIHGPSVPMMMGTTAHPVSADGKGLEPVEQYGVMLMSIGFLLEDPRQAVVWRGPMLQGVLLQFLKDVRWGKLDYLLIDLPPGTGDVPLTLSQKIRLTGSVIVTTPQEIALQDVYKAVSMCQKVDIPVLGVVENESYFVCDQCGKKHFIFGTGGGEKIAEMAGAPLLGQIPIDQACRESGDSGVPVVVSAPESASAKALVQIAERLAARIAVVHARRGATVISIDQQAGDRRRLPVVR